MKRHPESVAWDRFAAENEEEFDSSTLGASAKHNRYLRNRMEKAFKAGIEFQKRRYRKGKNETV
jgi:hypothetical protein